MSANQTTFKTLGIDKETVINDMDSWLEGNMYRAIMISESERMVMAIEPANEDTLENPDMYMVSLAYCNSDETKFRKNVGAWIAYDRLTSGIFVPMRREMVNSIIMEYDMESW